MAAPATDAEALYAALSPGLALLARRGVLRRFRKHVTLIEEGTLGDTMYLVLAGKVKACSIDHRDREIIYGIYGPGDYVGEMSLDGGPRSASVIALEATTCAVLTRGTLQDHIVDHPEFAFELLSRVIQRARLATLAARNLALLDVYGRLVHLLDTLARPLPDGTRCIPERLTHADIASRIGASREMVSRLLKDLQNGQYTAVDRGVLRLLKPLPPAW